MGSKVHFVEMEYGAIILSVQSLEDFARVDERTKGVNFSKALRYRTQNGEQRLLLTSDGASHRMNFIFLPRPPLLLDRGDKA